MKVYNRPSINISLPHSIFKSFLFHTALPEYSTSYSALPPLKPCSIYNSKDSGMSELEGLLSLSLILKFRRLRLKDLKGLAAGCLEPVGTQPGAALRPGTQQVSVSVVWPLHSQHDPCPPSALGLSPPPQHPAPCILSMEEMFSKYLLMDCFCACVSHCPGGLYVPPAPAGNMPALMLFFVPFWYSVQTWF